MAGINKAIIVGRLGKDPEVRYTPDGTAVANFTVATSEEWKDKGSGEKRERTEWHRIVAFARLGEICGEYLSKGRQVYLEGRIQTRDWEDRDGNKRYTTEIVASQMQMLGPKESYQAPGSYGNAAPAARAPASNNAAQATQPAAPAPAVDAQDDDIPF